MWAASAVLALPVSLTACGGLASDAGSDRAPTSPSAAASSAQARPGAFFHADRRADVLAIRGEQDQSEARPAPRQRLSDIRDVRVVHTADQVRIRVRFFDLRLEGMHRLPPYFRVEAVVRTSKGLGLGVALDFSSRVVREYAHDVRGFSAHCPFGHSVHDRTNVVDIRIPRSRCLDDPEWVRVRVDSVVWVHDPADTVAWDYAVDRRGPSRDDTGRFSPRIPARR